MGMLHAPVYSALLGGTLLILQILLMLSVGIHRTRVKKGVGVEGDVTLERLVRRHGNLAENAAIFVVVLALYELIFGQTTLALTAGCVFLVGRLLHLCGFASAQGSHLIDAEGFGSKYVLMRSSGAFLTALSALVLASVLVVRAGSGV